MPKYPRNQASESHSKPRKQNYTHTNKPPPRTTYCLGLATALATAVHLPSTGSLPQPSARNPSTPPGGPGPVNQRNVRAKDDPLITKLERQRRRCHPHRTTYCLGLATAPTTAMHLPPNGRLPKSSARNIPACRYPPSPAPWACSYHKYRSRCGRASDPVRAVREAHRAPSPFHKPDPGLISPLQILSRF